MNTVPSAHCAQVVSPGNHVLTEALDSDAERDLVRIFLGMTHAIVNDPKHAKVHLIRIPDGIQIVISVSQRDFATVIGKGARNATAIRVLALACGRKMSLRVTVDFQAS